MKVLSLAMKWQTLAMKVTSLAITLAMKHYSLAMSLPVKTSGNSYFTVLWQSKSFLGNEMANFGNEMANIGNESHFFGNEMANIGNEVISLAMPLAVKSFSLPKITSGSTLAK